jgi:MFS family permease
VAIQRYVPISNEQFSYLQAAFLLSYAALYIGGGLLLDLLGTRRGFALIMLWWSIACALHGFASAFGMLLCARFRCQVYERLSMVLPGDLGNRANAELPGGLGGESGKQRIWPGRMVNMPGETARVRRPRLAGTRREWKKFDKRG